MTFLWTFICFIFLKIYNVPQQNWPLFLQAHNSINKASNSNLLGVKWKPLISTFQWCHWIWDFYLNCLRYLRKHDSNLDIEAAQNDLLLIQGVCKERLISIWWLINLVWKLPYCVIKDSFEILRFSAFIWAQEKGHFMQKQLRKLCLKCINNQSFWAVSISKLLSCFLTYLRQFQSKSHIQWHHWKAEIKGFHLTPRMMGLEALLM